MQNQGFYYKQDNWEVDQYTIKGFFSGGTWVINPQDVEFIQQCNIASHGNVAMYDMFIKTRNIQEPYFIGRYQSGTYSMRDALASYASIHNLQFSYVNNVGYAPQNANNRPAYNYQKTKKKKGKTAAIVSGVILVIVVGAIILVNTKDIIFALIGVGLAGVISLFSIVFGKKGRRGGGYYDNDYYDSRQMYSEGYNEAAGHDDDQDDNDYYDYDDGGSDGDSGGDD